MEALKAVLGTGKSAASMTDLGTGSALQDPFDNDDSDFWSNMVGEASNTIESA